jgi:hypothetical protein
LGGRGRRISEFEASLVYKVSFPGQPGLYRETLFRKKLKKKKKKKKKLKKKKIIYIYIKYMMIYMMYDIII